MGTKLITTGVQTLQEPENFFLAKEMHTPKKKHVPVTEMLNYYNRK